MFVIDEVAARAFQQFVEAQATAGHPIRYGYGTWDDTHKVLVTRAVVRQFEQWAQAMLHRWRTLAGGNTWWWLSEARWAARQAPRRPRRVSCALKARKRYFVPRARTRALV
jgi:hypothetical protein